MYAKIIAKLHKQTEILCSCDSNKLLDCLRLEIAPNESRSGSHTLARAHSG